MITRFFFSSAFILFTSMVLAQTFPIGTFWVKDPNGLERPDQYGQVGDCGINIIVGGANHVNADLQTILDEADNRNIRIIVNHATYENYICRYATKVSDGDVTYRVRYRTTGKQAEVQLDTLELPLVYNFTPETGAGIDDQYALDGHCFRARVGVDTSGYLFSNYSGANWYHNRESDYLATFRLKMEGDNALPVPVANLQIIYDGAAILDAPLIAQDFVQPGQYEEFEIPFAVPLPPVIFNPEYDLWLSGLLPEGLATQQLQVPVDFRVYWHGNRTLYVDDVVIENSRGDELLDGVQDTLIEAEANNTINLDPDHDTVIGYYGDEPFLFNIETVAYVNNLIGPYTPAGAENPVVMNASLVDLRYYIYHQYLNAGLPNYQDFSLLSNIYPMRDGQFDPPGSPNYNENWQRCLNNEYIPQIAAAYRAANFNKRDFWCAVQAHHWYNIRHPHPNEIKAMVNLALAYGAKGIFYFLYASLDDTDREGLVNRVFRHDYEPFQSKWDTVHVINNNLQILASDLLSLEWQNAFTLGVDTTPSGSMVQSMSGGADIEAANFIYPGTGEAYFMLVNRRCEDADTQTFTVNLQSNSSQRRLVEDVLASRTEWEGNSGRVAYRILEPGQTAISVTLLPGEGRLFRVCNGLSGSLGGERYWSGDALLNGTLIVESGETLHIYEGTEVRIAGYNSLFVRANGLLTAEGSETHPVLFTSATASSPNSWKYIYINGSGNTFNHCIFEYGYWAVFLRGYPTPVTNFNFFNNCIIKDSIHGIRIRFSTGKFNDCFINDNTMGIVVSETSHSYCDKIKIFDNSQYGVYGLGSNFMTFTCSVIENNGATGNRPGIYVTYGDYLGLCSASSDGRNTIRWNAGDEIKGGSGSPQISSIGNSIHDILEQGIYELYNTPGNPEIEVYNTWFGEDPPEEDQFYGPIDIHSTMYEEPDWEGTTDCGSGAMFEQGQSGDFISRLDPPDETTIQKLKKTILDTESESDAVGVLHELYAILRRDFFENRFGEKEQFFSFLQNVYKTKSGALKKTAIQYMVIWKILQYRPAEAIELCSLALKTADKTEGVFYLKQMAQMYAELEDFKSADKVLADCAKKAKDDPDIPLIQQEIDALRELAAETKGDGKGMAADNPIFFESVKEPESGVLLQNYPNPFNNSTEIQYTLPQAATVTLRIFDITGRLVRILENARYYEAGPHRTIWNGLDDNGRPVASGVYYCRLQFGGPWRNLKLLVLK